MENPPTSYFHLEPGVDLPPGLSKSGIYAGWCLLISLAMLHTSENSDGHLVIANPHNLASLMGHGSKSSMLSSSSISKFHLYCIFLILLGEIVTKHGNFGDDSISFYRLISSGSIVARDDGFWVGNAKFWQQKFGYNDDDDSAASRILVIGAPYSEFHLPAIYHANTDQVPANFVGSKIGSVGGRSGFSELLGVLLDGPEIYSSKSKLLF